MELVNVSSAFYFADDQVVFTHKDETQIIYVINYIDNTGNGGLPLDFCKNRIHDQGPNELYMDGIKIKRTDRPGLDNRWRWKFRNRNHKENIYWKKSNRY